MCLEGHGHERGEGGAEICAVVYGAQAAVKQIIEAEEIPENVLEVLENRVVKSLSGARARKTRVAVGVVKLSLLRIAQHAVCFRALTELDLRIGFVLRIAVRMPFQRRFAVGRLDLFDRCRPRNAEHFVIIALIPLGHGNFGSPLIHCFFRCGVRMHRYTHHRRTQHAAVKDISRLKNLQDGAVGVLRCFGAVHGLVQMRIETLSGWINALDAQARQMVRKLLVNQLEPFPVALVFRFAVRRKGVLEAVNHGNEALNDSRRRALGIFKALLLDACPVIVEISLPSAPAAHATRSSDRSCYKRRCGARVCSPPGKSPSRQSAGARAAVFRCKHSTRSRAGASLRWPPAVRAIAPGWRIPECRGSAPFPPRVFAKPIHLPAPPDRIARERFARFLRSVRALSQASAADPCESPPGPSPTSADSKRLPSRPLRPD